MKSYLDCITCFIQQVIRTACHVSDAPGTLPGDCFSEFQSRFVADLIIVKGQGNYETLSDTPHNIFFLFKIKCPVIAGHIGQSVGIQVLIKSNVNSVANGSAR